jgi:hypothetical protein
MAGILANKESKSTLNSKLSGIHYYLLTIIRFSNTFTTSKKKAFTTESVGRTIGMWWSVINKPKVLNEKISIILK